METNPQTTVDAAQSAPRDLSMTIRRWTREVAHFRTRVVRLTRSSAVADAPENAALEEAVTVCTHLLQDLAGAQMEIQRRIEQARTERLYGDHLFDRMLMPCLCADDNGRITRANRAAALLLNVSVRHLVGQPLLHFTLDRDGFIDVLRRMRRDRTQCQFELMIRPRERAAIHAGVTLMPRSPEDPTEWLWFLAPGQAGAAHAAPARRRMAAAAATAPMHEHVASVIS